MERSLWQNNRTIKVEDVKGNDATRKEVKEQQANQRVEEVKEQRS
jgi:uncharacterized protein YnzC (UPF0291/DUF896 family)